MCLTDTPLGSRVEDHRAQIVAITERYGGRSIAVFGSVASGTSSQTSDVDFLVDFEPGRSLLDLIHLEDDLAALLGCPVDVVSLGALLDRDDRIRQDAVRL